jgi:hypothetical protein
MHRPCHLPIYPSPSPLTHINSQPPLYLPLSLPVSPIQQANGSGGRQVPTTRHGVDIPAGLVKSSAVPFN